MTFRTAAVLAAEGPVVEGLQVLTVSELCERLREVVRAQPQPVHVGGEVRDLTRAPSGHAYFNLRDDGAQLACVLFRADADAAPGLRDGAAVVVHADLDFYPGRGQPQLLVRTVRPRGVGDLWVAFEATRAALARDGLLAAGRKRPLPRFPRRVGLVTSETGAAIRDVLTVLRRRYPLASVLLAPASVQGEGAADGVSRAIRTLDARGDVDVILVARGGGSADDLWAFNDEGLARAIAASRVPVVAAIGHETDVTIAGLVADVRAPTPSAAAELAVPDAAEIERALAALRSALARGLVARLRDARLRVDALGTALSPASLAVRASASRHRLTAAHAGLRAFVPRLLRHRQTLDAARARLEALSPLATLRRGFAVAIKDGRVLASVAGVAAGDSFLMLLQDGDMECRVVRTRRR